MPLGLRFDDALAPASGGAGRYSTDAAGFAVSGLELDMIRQHSCTQQQSGEIREGAVPLLPTAAPTYAAGCLDP